MYSNKREFIQSDNTHSSIHSQQLNTILQRQKPVSYQRPNNSRHTTTPTTAADLVAAAAGDGHNNTSYDNNIFDCNGGGSHRPPLRDDETRSTRGRRKRSSTLPPSSISVSTKTSLSKRVKTKHPNKGVSASTLIVPNSFDSNYGLGTLSTNSKVSKSKSNYDTIKSPASSISISSVASLNVFEEEDADSIVGVGCVDNSTNASLEEEEGDDDEEEVDLEDNTDGLGMLYLLLGYPVYYC